MRRLLPIATSAVLLALGACPADPPAAPPSSDVAAADAPAADAAPDGDAVAPAVCAARDPLKRAYFGDTHVHTSYSLDAVLQGTRLTPDDAYRFAKGEAVGIQPYDASGAPLRTLQLARPLDFAVVSDHAEFLGEVHLCTTPGSIAYDTAECELFRDDPQTAFLVINTHLSFAPQDAAHPDLCGPDAGAACRDASRAFWDDTQAAAAAHNDAAPSCGFTTFVGYEWSGSPGTNNLHRNVIFRGAAVPELPISYFDAPYPEQLWEQLQRDCLAAGAGCDVLAIPHNSNLSSGTMFESAADWLVRDADQARWRAQIEPLVEIFQHKGDSECAADAADELCGFEKMPYANLSGPRTGVERAAQPLDFVRAVLGEGLLIQQALGANPYRLGIIASTDTHLGAPGAVSESDHPGHGGAGPAARDALPEGLPDVIAFNPGGLAVLWAEENSRDALFEAMRRREAYGTSGPRITLRFFGGWDYPDDLCARADLVEVGYAQGAPMGGELGASPGAGAAPVFALNALQDPGVTGAPGTPLQRLQIVKGWVEGGQARTQVFDVAGDAANGASVDLATCQPQGAGAATLCAVWRDPAFDPAAAAFYYARAVENPTCRWSTHLCQRAGIDCADPAAVPQAWRGCCDGRYPKTVQERAWSSPVWYTP